MKTIGLACDHAGFELKEYVRGWLEAKGWAYKDFGTNSTASVDYPDYAHPLALAVESGECYPGIAICGSGNGINMTPVSYTHLDVYKRQAYSSATSGNITNGLVGSPPRFCLLYTSHVLIASSRWPDIPPVPYSF